jgi:hypothetical protein
VRYVGDKIGQIDGTSYEQLNCVAAVTAALIDIATVGRVRVTPAQMRKASGVTARRGLTLSEAADAAVRLTGIVLEPRFLSGDGTQRGRLRDRLVAGQALGLVYDADVTYGTPDATNYFRGNHMAVFGAYAWTDHAQLYGDDPGTTQAGWRWWDFGRMCRAAEKVGGGGIWVLLARDTEGVTRYVRQQAAFRMEPRVDAPAAGQALLGRSQLVLATRRGGPWQRADGTTAVGWHYVQKRTGTRAWLKGLALA